MEGPWRPQDYFREHGLAVLYVVGDGWRWRWMKHCKGISHRWLTYPSIGVAGLCAMVGTTPNGPISFWWKLCWANMPRLPTHLTPSCHHLATLPRVLG